MRPLFESFVGLSKSNYYGGTTVEELAKFFKGEENTTDRGGGEIDHLLIESGVRGLSGYELKRSRIRG